MILIANHLVYFLMVLFFPAGLIIALFNFSKRFDEDSFTYNFLVLLACSLILVLVIFVFIVFTGLQLNLLKFQWFKGFFTGLLVHVVNLFPLFLRRIIKNNPIMFFYWLELIVLVGPLLYILNDYLSSKLEEKEEERIQKEISDKKEELQKLKVELKEEKQKITTKKEQLIKEVKEKYKKELRNEILNELSPKEQKDVKEENDLGFFQQ